MNDTEITYVDCCWMCNYVSNKHNDCWCSLRDKYVSTFAICPNFILNNKFAEYKLKDSPYWNETRWPEEGNE